MDIVLKLNPESADIAPIRDGIIAHNQAKGGDPKWQPFALHLKDDSGTILGGLNGYTVYDWLFIELFHLSEASRGQGHGRALMARAEEFARERGCIGIWLDTFSFQARPFYEKLGFTVFGTIANHPVGGARYFMQKRLG